MSDNTTDTPKQAGKLVSIICRTTGRKELATALASIARQTYRPIEIILVDAIGKGIADYQQHVDQIPVKLVSTGKPLARSQAANIGVDSSSGYYLMFLDDDDWVSADHIANLVKLLATRGDSRGAYSSTQKTDKDGKSTKVSFRISYDPVRLMLDNYMPIHSVVFEKSLTDEGCRFDKSMDIYEDWDFWLQVSQLTPLVHLDKITAFYREGGDSETAISDLDLRFKSGNAIADAREALYNKWLKKWSGQQLNSLLGSLDKAGELEALDKKLVDINQLLVESDRNLSERNNQLDYQKMELVNLASQLSQLEFHSSKHIAELESAISELYNSFSWKITKPYRWLKLRFDKYFFRPLFTLIKNLAKIALTPFPGIDRRIKKYLINRNIEASETNLDSSIHFAIDSPGSICNQIMTVRGWALASGDEVTISVFIDDLEYTSFAPSVPRPDIESVFPGNPNALNSGFAESISLAKLESGEHTFELTFNTNAGVQETLSRTFYLFHGNELYNAWLHAVTPTDAELKRLADSAVEDDASKHVHVVLTETSSAQALYMTLVSLLKQTTEQWTCHIAGLQWSSIAEVLSEEDRLVLRDKLQQHDEIEIMLRTLQDLDSYFLCIQSGDVLFPHALHDLVAQAESENEDLVYSDHDQVNLEKEHDNPCFTFSWSPEYLYASNYIGGVYLGRTRLLKQVAGIQYSAAWQYQLLLTLGDTTEKIGRVTKILWSKLEDPRIRKTDDAAAEIAALENYLASKSANAVVRHANGNRLVDWQLDSNPIVSIIIPTMGKLGLLEPCIKSLLEKTAYDNYEVIILDNSRGKNPEGIAYLKAKGFKIIECDEEFNWARLNNIGARSATGDLLLFLNDDIEIIENNWLEELVKQACRESVGAVGGLLLYPNGAIQHAGVFLVNYGGGCAHLFHKMMPGPDIYLRLDTVAREVSANTGACLMVRKALFESNGGFDEELAVVGNDVDFCLRLLQGGYRNIWTPACKLIHHESISRKAKVPRKDELAMWKRWGSLFKSGDRYYNPNLTLTSVDCSLNVDNAANNIVQQFNKSRPRLAPPQPSSLLPGVNLIAYIRADMGLGEAARSDARALTAANIDFGIINFETGNPAKMTDFSWQHKEFESPVYDVNLIHINADHMQSLFKELPAYFFKDRYNIGYWAWELPEIPSEWMTAFKYLDEIWVPSEFVKTAVAAKSPIPVIRIPHCVDIEPVVDIHRDDFGLPDNTFLFLTMFDTRSIAQRKNPFGTVNAFKKAFDKNDESVCLVLNVNNSDVSEMEKLRTAISANTNIVILEEPHSRQEINALLGLIDCYVSLHRSEGFGLPPAEAMSLGKATIITNWSGSTDYMTADNCLAIDYSLVEIEEDFGPYKAGQIWAEPDIEQAATAMHSLASDHELAKRLGNNAMRTIKESFSPAAVGKMIQQRLEEIRSGS